MQKIVINACFGGYSLSKAAEDWFRLKFGEEVDPYDRPRDCKKLVHCVQLLGSKEASGAYAELKIVEVPDGIKWEIEEYDGREHVAQVHETWS